jgi:hypothetical protein
MFHAHKTHPPSPMFLEYTGIDNEMYGCGMCETWQKDRSCKECTGSAVEACNKEVKEGQ